jgi:hypothetical protein
MRRRPVRASGPDSGSGFPGVGVVERDEGAGDVPSDLGFVASLISVQLEPSAQIHKKENKKEKGVRATCSFRVSSLTSWSI